MTKVENFASVIIADAQKQIDNLDQQNFFIGLAKSDRHYVKNGGFETLERMVEILKKEWLNANIAYAIKEMSEGLTSAKTRKFIQEGGLD